ncbi:twitching motility protein PilI [Nitrosomonas sp. Nm84]|uniref:chemotaxis protein CheW n=1 Tax=Nitrosomonas sp. Nm84 TaxID=200124 RepID=UPI000D752E95|nr:chemotaxis protein CheW [Nitrosomonas sp. Nm84]PXW87628.1 twitching motility protein PilI [Nitrosomonas sp. Nm84]
MSTEKYQHTSSKQIESIDINEPSSAVLGVATGEDRYLIPMAEVNEVIPIPKLAHVPLTQSWFLGLANVRGNLYGITDLGVYLGGDPMSFNLKSRILLVSSGNKVYSGFIVNSMLGIRNLAEFTPMKSAKKKLPQGITAQYKDTEGRVWKELSLFELLHEEKFFQVARK